MFQIRGLNKKGAESDSGLGMLTSIALVVAVVIIVLVAANRTSEAGEVLIETATPADLEGRVQTCLFHAKQGTTTITTFCEDFDLIPILGNDQYISCDYPGVKTTLRTIKATDGGFNIPTCSPDTQKRFCEDLKLNKPEEYKDELLVDRQTCGKWIDGTAIQFELSITTAPNSIMISDTREITANVKDGGVVEPGIEVKFSISSGEGTLNKDVATTNSEGNAVVTFTAPLESETTVITAELTDKPSVAKALITFTITSRPLADDPVADDPVA